MTAMRQDETGMEGVVFTVEYCHGLGRYLYEEEVQLADANIDSKLREMHQAIGVNEDIANLITDDAGLGQRVIESVFYYLAGADPLADRSAY